MFLYCKTWFHDVHLSEMIWICSDDVISADSDAS